VSAGPANAESDVVGVVNPGRVAIGDTLCAGRIVEFPRIPRFPAEQFAVLRPSDIRHKRFDEAVAQLAEEGLLQVFMPTSGTRHPIIGVIGSLQLDVVQARMSSEYGIPCSVDRLPHIAARWPVQRSATPLVVPTSGVWQARDQQQRDVLVFEAEWVLKYTLEKNPHIDFRESM
jgi:peptide chain release factor 3